jgi:cytochrome c
MTTFRRVAFAAIIATVASLFFLQCKSDSSKYDAMRANDPWVFRSVLDSMPRMVTLALHDKLWIAYRTDKCAVYKSWRDGVDFVGAVYNTDHGPQPTTLGDAWFENQHSEPWYLEANGKQEPAKSVQYRGHVFEKGQVWLRYEITNQAGQTVTVYEQPEVVDDGGSNVGLIRTFKVEKLPAGTQIGLKINVASVVSEQSIETNGKWKQTSSTPGASTALINVNLDGQLTLLSDQPTTFKTMFVVEPQKTNARSAEEKKKIANLHPGELLVNKNDCKTCHNEQVKTVGPAYIDIATKYPNTSENVAMLLGKVKKGGAGVWGAAAMTAHPQLENEDIKTMIEYIMLLDKDNEKSGTKSMAGLVAPSDEKLKASENIPNDSLLAGFWARAYSLSGITIDGLKDLSKVGMPIYEGALPSINAGGGDYKDLTEHFAIIGSGYLDIPKDNNYLFRLNSDDGASLMIDGVLVCDNDGFHGDDKYAEGEIQLKKGLHAFSFKYFNGAGGRAMKLQWKSFDSGEFALVPVAVFKHKWSERRARKAGDFAMAANNTIPGDRSEPLSMHPSFDVLTARPASFMPKVGGMDFLPNGNMVVSTWDAMGAVYSLTNTMSGDSNLIKSTLIAKGLAEPLGLKVVDKEIYVLQKHELTRLADKNGDGIMDEYYTVCNAWKVSGNFHEFAFGLVEKDGWLYAALATAIQPGGASTRPQIIDRGRVIRVNIKTGALEFVAQGLRTPNGIGIGVDGELFVADNQGDWLPSSKIVHVKQGAFYGSFSVDSVNQSKMTISQPVVWLPQDEIGNSPTQPISINDGPYKGQMIHGDLTHGGIKRVFVEKVNGEYQGCVFRFIEGLEAGVNRLVYGPDGSLFVGGIGNPGNWQQNNKLWYGLQRVIYNKKPTFEILAVRAKSNGVEVEYTQALDHAQGWQPDEYDIQQWRYVPTINYGGPKVDQSKLVVKSATVSADRRKVFLEIPGMKAGNVLHVRMAGGQTSEQGQSLWTTEAWYTMNAIPSNQDGVVKAPDESQYAGPNTLTPAQQKAGWQLLFDGKTTTGWHCYGQKSVAASWFIQNDALVFAKANKDSPGGDLTTDKEYTDYELNLEWKVSDCGNSGIIYRVHEDPKFSACYMTGPEMQILDNSCHPDGQFAKHRAGDLYDMKACTYETVRPAGQWNKVRLIIKGTHIEHWLNGYLVVQYHTSKDLWKTLVQDSKFKDWEGFGNYATGRISLQDHGDKVQFRNVRIKEL